MAPVYADHPFNLVSTPVGKLSQGIKPNAFQRAASEMAIVHNFILRGLNAIYLQAPHIKPEDESSFANHILQWYRFVDSHHRGEERLFFPAVDKLAGTTGVMEGNIEQHKAFHDGIDEFARYIMDVIAKREKYDGQRIVALIDNFGVALYTHLEDEIPTILGLERFGAEKMECVEQVLIREGQEVMKEVGLLTGLPWAVSNQDNAFEGGIWAKFPPDPVGRAIVGFVRHVTWWFHRDWWKFGACDGNGNMKPLYAFPDDGN